MSNHDVPIFFKRRFNERLFEGILNFSMEEWVGISRRDFREYEINVLNETIHNYFVSLYGINVYEELDISDVYKFQDYVSEKYEKVLREYWNDNR